MKNSIKTLSKIFRWWIRSKNSLIGWWKLKFVFQFGKYYVSPYIKGKRYMYRGGKKFYCAYGAQCPDTPVALFGQYECTFKYWEISILNFKRG